MCGSPVWKSWRRSSSFMPFRQTVTFRTLIYSAGRDSVPADPNLAARRRHRLDRHSRRAAIADLSQRSEACGERSPAACFFFLPSHGCDETAALVQVSQPPFHQRASPHGDRKNDIPSVCALRRQRRQIPSLAATKAFRADDSQREEPHLLYAWVIRPQGGIPTRGEGLSESRPQPDKGLLFFCEHKASERAGGRRGSPRATAASTRLLLHQQEKVEKQKDASENAPSHPHPHPRR